MGIASGLMRLTRREGRLAGTFRFAHYLAAGWANAGRHEVWEKLANRVDTMIGLYAECYEALMVMDY